MNVTKPTELFSEESQDRIKRNIIKKIESTFDNLKKFDSNLNKSFYSITITDLTKNHKFIYPRVCAIYKMAGWTDVSWATCRDEVTFAFYIK